MEIKISDYQYRNLVELIIQMCNVASTTFAQPAYFNTPIKLTPHEIQIIEAILEDKDENMTIMAARLGISKGGFSNNIKKLIKKGCLVKEHKEGNRKNLYPAVTPCGTEVYWKYSQHIFEACFKEFFKLADTIPNKHIKTFEKMLKHFINGLERD
jgi:DNA-binding MarR family transcriptional regulator